MPVPTRKSEHAEAAGALSRPRHRDSNSRRATAALEFALVSPLMFLFFFGSVEFGRAITIMHALESAAREGCRVAVTWKATRQDVAETVSERLATFGIRDYTLTVDPNDPSRAPQWTPVRVRIDVAYGDLAWLPVPKYLQAIKLSGSSTLPQESDPSES